MPSTLAWGFHRLADIANQRVADNVAAVRTAVAEFVAAQNASWNALSSSLVEVTTDSTARFTLPGTMEMQPGNELSRPTPQRYAELFYSLGWPVQKADLATGQTYEQQQTMDIATFAGYAQAIGLADTKWMQRHLLGALFYNGAGYTYDDVEDTAGAITVLGLANGDTQTYLKESGALSGSTDNHYLFQSTDILSASDPIPEMVTALTEHPFNSGDVFIIVSAADEAKYRALASVYPSPDPNLQAPTSATIFIGSVPSGSTPGPFLGYHSSGAYIFKWRSLPQNYAFAYMTGGTKPIRQREKTVGSLRGFKNEAVREDYPYAEEYWVRRAGFGGWNRVGACVKRMNQGSYSIPTGYATPMP